MIPAAAVIVALGIINVTLTIVVVHLLGIVRKQRVTIARWRRIARLNRGTVEGYRRLMDEGARL